ncbi:hypothetical protein [Desulforamulus reducens]|uniref:prenylated flavin chaperone LpdD n=1 Tax=Desulforamulus reducens TaxID=59610 RepID=UPI00031A91C1
MKVHLVTTFTSEGLVCQLYGGEKYHVGAVVLSIPRPSLQDSVQISSNSSVLPLLGHKDDEIAKPLAESLAIYFKEPVVMVAGIHIDHATKEEINNIIKNCWQAAKKLMEGPQSNSKNK